MNNNLPICTSHQTPDLRLFYVGQLYYLKPLQYRFGRFIKKQKKKKEYIYIYMDFSKHIATSKVSATPMI